MHASQRMDEYLVDPPLPFYPWLRHIAWQRLVDLQRQHVKAQRRSVYREVSPVMLSNESEYKMAERFVASGDTPSEGAVKEELRHRVRSALEKLDPVDREILLMRYVEQMPTKDAAAAMGMAPNTFSQRHLRALPKLKKLLDEDSAP